MAARILVPLDDSPSGSDAVLYAFGLATRMRGDICIARLREEKQGDARVVMLSRAQAGDAGAERAYAAPPDAYEPNVRTLDSDEPVPIHTFVANAGITAVVMAAHERNAVLRAVRGTIDDHVVRQLGIPVILLHPRHGAESAPPFELNHVVAPLDGSSDAERALDAVLAFDHVGHLRFTLVRVLEERTVATYPVIVMAEIRDTETEHDRAQAADYLEGVASRLRQRGMQADTLVIIRHDAARALLEEMRVLQPDLIAMVTHSRGGWRHHDVGGVTAQVLHHTTWPVLLLNVTAAVPGMAGVS